MSTFVSSKVARPKKIESTKKLIRSLKDKLSSDFNPVDEKKLWVKTIKEIQQMK